MYKLTIYYCFFDYEVPMFRKNVESLDIPYGFLEKNGFYDFGNGGTHCLKIKKGNKVLLAVCMGRRYENVEIQE